MRMKNIRTCTFRTCTCATCAPVFLSPRSFVTDLWDREIDSDPANLTEFRHTRKCLAFYSGQAVTPLDLFGWVGIWVTQQLLGSYSMKASSVTHQLWRVVSDRKDPFESWIFKGCSCSWDQGTSLERLPRKWREVLEHAKPRRCQSIRNSSVRNEEFQGISTCGFQILLSSYSISYRSHVIVLKIIQEW